MFVSAFDIFFPQISAIQQPSSFAQARHIIKTDGFGSKGLNKGLTSTLGRHGVFNMIYFGFYFNVKDAIPTSQVKMPTNDHTPVSSPVLDFVPQSKHKPTDTVLVW